MTLKLIVPLMFAALAASPAFAQISMQRPGITGVPQGRKMSAPTQAPAAVSLTAGEQQQLITAIKHMKRKDRKRLAMALQKMTPQQRQQLLLSVKKQLAQQPIASKHKGRR